MNIANAADHRAVSRALREWFKRCEKDLDALNALGGLGVQALIDLTMIARRADFACVRDEIEDAAIAAGERKRLEVVR